MLHRGLSRAIMGACVMGRVINKMRAAPLPPCACFAAHHDAAAPRCGGSACTELRRGPAAARRRRYGIVLLAKNGDAAPKQPTIARAQQRTDRAVRAARLGCTSRPLARGQPLASLLL